MTERQSPADRLPHIETSQARYYPLYEFHDHPAGYRQLRQLPVMDLHFMEMATPSSFVLSQPVRDILGSFVYIPFSTRPVVHDRTITDETLNYFSEHDVWVSFESIGFSQHMLKDSQTNWNLQTGVGTAAALLTIHQLDQLIEDKHHRNESLARLLPLLALAAWALGPRLASLVRPSSDPSPENHLAWKISGHTFNLHPEEPLVFLRNIVMARKMKLIAETLPSLKPLTQKPVISSQMGGAHSAFEHYLSQTDQSDFSLIHIYSKTFLQELISYNGGLKAFCSTLLLPIKNNWCTDSNRRHIIYDQALANYLQSLL